MGIPVRKEAADRELVENTSLGLSRLLIRPKAWWKNKIPLSILLVFLLVDGAPFSVEAIVALIGVIGVVCGVANYGYALNELFDREEDRRANRENAAILRSDREMWLIILGSAFWSVAVAALVGGLPAGLLTTLVLFLPLTYSVWPFRTKERGWLGVFSDALAAHVFPAALALLVVHHQSLPLPRNYFMAAIIAWALATGLRGILSHQLHDDKKDLAAGLTTVAHHHGHDNLSRLVICFILPVEIALFFGLVWLLPGHTVLKVAALAFCVLEQVRWWLGRQPLYRFTTWWKGYIPFADDGFYKVWGPLALGVDLVLSSPLYLPLPLLFVRLFFSRIRTEFAQILSAAADLWGKISPSRSR